MRAVRRWVAGDLGAHWGQAALTGGIVAGVVTCLVLAAMLLEGASSPWLGLYDRTHGPDVVVYLAPGTQAGRLGGLAGVTQASQPVQSGTATLEQVSTATLEQVSTATLEQGDTQVELRAMPPAAPAMLTPFVVAGSWLSAARPDGVVVEASFAAAARLTVGSPVTLPGPGHITVSARVIGIAETSGQVPYPQWTPGLAWVTPALLHRVDLQPGTAAEVIGLRLASRCPVCVTDAVDEVSSAVGPQNVQQSVSWQQVSQAMAANGWLLGEFLGLFGLIGLAAAVCAIANVTAARAVAQRQSTALLKAIGFTPGQVAVALLGENLLLAAGGTVTGLAFGWGLTRAAPAFAYAPGGAPVTLAPLPAGLTALIAGTTMLAVAIATVVQAGRAARVPATAAVTASPPRGKLSRLARVGLLARFPAPVVLGARDAFTRRAQAALTIAGVAIPMALAVIALASWTTIDGLARDPGRISVAPLTAYPSPGAGGLPHLPHNDSVQAVYPGAEFQVPLPGQAGTFTARAMGTTTRPYPFRIVAGRLYQQAGEAVASQRLLAELGTRVGGSVWATINGDPVTFQVVGEVIDPSGDGDVLDFPVQALPYIGGSPQFYSVILTPGADPSRVAAQLRAASGGRLDVQLTANPASGLGPLRLVIVITAVLLAVLGLANLVTATRAGLRDHLPEAGVLAALGLTPAQVTATFIIAVGLLAAAGVLAGTLIGLAAAYWLINAQGAAIGLGWGIESLLPGLGLLLAAMAVAILAGTATALLVVRRCVVASHGAVRVSRAAAPVAP